MSSSLTKRCAPTAGTLMPNFVVQRITPSCVFRTRRNRGRSLILNELYSGGKHTEGTPAASRRHLLYTAPALGLLSMQGILTIVRPSLATEKLRPLTSEEKKVVEKALLSVAPKPKAPVTLRLVFHDAATFSTQVGNGGANASIQYELNRPENFGLKRGWAVIEALSTKLKGTAAESLSKADMIALTGAHAVAVTGGPEINVPVGRIDSTSADPEDRLPAETLTSQELIKAFSNMGLSVQELVVLSGSHTLGGKGFGDPLTFDNTYFKSLLNKPWLNKQDEMAAMIGIASDHVLPEDEACMPYIQKYASDNKAFFDDFSTAFIKLTCLGA